MKVRVHMIGSPHGPVTRNKSGGSFCIGLVRRVKDFLLLIPWVAVVRNSPSLYHRHHAKTTSIPAPGNHSEMDGIAGARRFCAASPSFRCRASGLDALLVCYVPPPSRHPVQLERSAAGRGLSGLEPFELSRHHGVRCGDALCVCVESRSEKLARIWMAHDD